jgi:hypothetical protein
MPMSSAAAPRPLLFIALCTFTSLPLLSQFPAVPSREAASPVKADGRSDEWSQTTRVRDKKSGAEFAFQNDGRNLYVLFSVTKSQALESVDSTGMTILARVGGTKKTPKGVLFLKRQVTAESYIRWHEGQGEYLTEAEKTELRKAGRHDLFLTFAVGARGSTYGPLRRLKESEPPEFGISADAAGATYEFEIPLASPDLVPGGIGAAPGETIRISFEWGGTARKILGTPASRQTPPSEAGGLFGVATPAQEFLNMFDSMSRPSMGTKKYAFAVDVKLAGAR